MDPFGYYAEGLQQHLDEAFTPAKHASSDEASTPRPPEAQEAHGLAATGSAANPAMQARPSLTWLACQASICRLHLVSLCCGICSLLTKTAALHALQAFT